MEGIRILDSKKKWPTTIIVGMVHGDEIVGKHVLKFFLEHTKKNPFCGKIILLEANIAAAKKNVRAIHTDLDRSFEPKGNSAEKGSDINDVEIKRAEEIKNFFKKIKIDYVFDFHSTPKESDAMILCTSQTRSHELAKKFPIKKIIKNLIDSVDGMSLVKYFTTRWAVGITFETGAHTNKKNIATALKLSDIVRNFHNQKKIPDQKNQESITVDEIVAISDPNFTFTRSYKSFDKLKPGEIRGKDSKKMYRSISEKILILPNTICKDELKKKPKTRLVSFGKKSI